MFSLPFICPFADLNAHMQQSAQSITTVTRTDGRGGGAQDSSAGGEEMDEPPITALNKRVPEK